MSRLIAVSQRSDTTGPPHDERRDALDVRVAAFVRVGGHWPVPVPSTLLADEVGAWCDALGINGVVLSGGNDIGTVPERDRAETALLAQARTFAMPLLGVCRGMQMMAHDAGTELVTTTGHVATNHTVGGDIGRSVNSYHTLALAGLPDGYRALARADDGTIEAMAHDTLPWEGWMWHPERESPFADADVARLAALFA